MPPAWAVAKCIHPRVFSSAPNCHVVAKCLEPRSFGAGEHTRPFMFLAIELCLTVICWAIAYASPQLGDSCLTRIEQRLSTLAQRRIVATLACGLLALGIRLALLPILPIPQPQVHDEFSYLLLSDTFAHGRLANPTHPMWVHFETFHVNWNPTYASMYYPGHGLFLAFGQVVMGHPFWGVWLSSGLMCAAICWALQGWLPPAWALAGGLVAVIRLATFSYWADSYWGGTVTALGGALVLGALPRIKQNHRTRNSVVLAIGMALLASTRPYEGLFFCLPVIVVLLLWMARKTSPSAKVCLTQVALPFTLVMVAAIGALGYYFWRVTGSPFTIPYQLNMRTYGLMFFPWEKIRPVEFHHAALRDFYRGGAVLGFYKIARERPLKLQFLKALVIWLFYFGPVLSMPWLAWLFTRPRGKFWKCLGRELRFLSALVLVSYVAIILTIHLGQPHYVAELTIVFYAVTLFLMRDLYGSQADRSSPTRFLARSVPLICLILFLARVAAPAFGATPNPSWIRTWCSQDGQNLERASILHQLEDMPGDHLVIVRYQPHHDFIMDEWVFNNADIDGSKVIWARDMGTQNAELLQYFSQRRIWLVEPDYSPPKLSRYVE